MSLLPARNGSHTRSKRGSTKLANPGARLSHPLTPEYTGSPFTKTVTSSLYPMPAGTRVAAGALTIVRRKAVNRPCCGFAGKSRLRFTSPDSSVATVIHFRPAGTESTGRDAAGSGPATSQLATNPGCGGPGSVRGSDVAARLMVML